MIIDSLRQYLLANPSVTSYVGTRIYPNHLPQGLDLRTSTPAISFFLVSSEYLYDTKGIKNLVSARVQVDTWSYSSSETIRLAAILRRSLAQFNKQMGYLYVAGGKILDEQSLAEEPKDGSEDWLYRKMQDYQFRYCNSRFLYSGSGGLSIGGSSA